MATYTGTRVEDTITPQELSAGVRTMPAGSGPPSAAADLIRGQGGNDTLGGGGGADSISGGSGDDTIHVRGAGSVMHGDAGNDMLTYDTDGTDAGTISGSGYGGAGNDSVRSHSFYPGGSTPQEKSRFLAEPATTVSARTWLGATFPASMSTATARRARQA